MIVLHVLLTILKIIGILLLLILGLILLLLAVVLIVPIRYRVSVTGAGEIKTLAGKLQASWMIHLISVKVEYLDQAVKGLVRIAWKKIPIGKEEEPEESTPPREADLVISGETSPEDLSVAEETPSEDSSVSQGIPPKDTSAEEQLKKELVTGKAEQEEKPAGEKSAMEKPAKEKTSLWEKIKALFQKIKYTFEKICANIKLLLEKKDRLVAFKDHPAHRNALSVLLREVKRVLGHLRPRKLRADVTLGFDDPYITGQVLAGLGIAYPFIGKDMHITPDFEKQIFQGDAYVTGKVRLIHLAAAAIRLLLTKDVRTTYHDIRHFKL